MKRCIIFLFAAFTYNHLLPHDVYIILHGTWSSETTWYTPGGDFFDALEKAAQQQNATVVPFHWNGANSIEVRNNTARNLAKLIETYSQSTNVIVIGHSHGGTVALLASHLLHKNKIAIMYTLGTPISTAIYPNMQRINYCYNLFSFEDLIQPVLGIFKREHIPHKRIANIRVVINDKEPDHAGLHDPLIGQWLPILHTIIQSQNKTMEPGIIYFNDNKAPICMPDTQRADLLERDNHLSLLMINALRKPYVKLPY